MLDKRDISDWLRIVDSHSRFKNFVGIGSLIKKKLIKITNTLIRQNLPKPMPLDNVSKEKALAYSATTEQLPKKNTCLSN